MRIARIPTGNRLTTLATIGGFLGAGKTTLIASAAAVLSQRGQRVVVVTNDQAPELVDTALISRLGVPTAEVAGSCFCCAFPDFTAKTQALIDEHAPEVILAEPVGSCVDIAATVLRPLAEQCPGRYSVAPFTVVVDPAPLIVGASDQSLDPDTAYIYGKQLAEADVIALNKCDLETEEALARHEARIRALGVGAEFARLSAATGAGVERWLDFVLARHDGGNKRVDVDYVRYAKGEAALGWLNATVELEGTLGWGTLRDWTRVLDELMADLTSQLTGIAHLKCLLRSAELVLVSNAVAGRDGRELRTLSRRPPDHRALLTINARVAVTPNELQRVTETALASLRGVRRSIVSLKCFAPAPPVPVHRVA